MLRSMFLRAFSSGASLVVHKYSGGLADAIAAQVERYEIVQRLVQDGCLLCEKTLHFSGRRCAIRLWLKVRAILRE